MCMHLILWMNLINRTIDIQEKLKIVKIYVQSQWRVVLLWYHIFWQSSIQRGRHAQLCIITSLKWIIQISSNFYCWVCKIAFYSPNSHCCLVNFPFKFMRCWRRIKYTILFWPYPYPDNSPPYRFWSWWVVLFRGSGPSGELSWWGIVLGIVVLVGNGWALFLSGGELSSWGVVLEPVLTTNAADHTFT